MLRGKKKLVHKISLRSHDHLNYVTPENPMIGTNPFENKDQGSNKPNQRKHQNN